MTNLIPKPISYAPGEGVFTLQAEARILVRPGDAQAAQAAQLLAGRLRPATGFRLPVIVSSAAAPAGSLVVALAADDHGLGVEGYALRVRPQGVELSAGGYDSLVYGIQTIRQLLPAEIESPTPLPGPWTLPACSLHDRPRFPWRGAMLDVARHFFDVTAVKRFIDLLALYKMNRLHLHLSDDQGWRLMIHSWPRLAESGGLTQVGARPGGFYTQAEYAEIIDYAHKNAIVVVPEIDMPGHTNAALAAYAELNCNGQAAAPYRGIEVGFSSLCVAKDLTYRFIADVLGELAALTPGPYLHIGGDEAAATPPGDYRLFIERLQPLVHALGKRMIGWEEIAQAALLPGAIAQHWHNDLVVHAARQGAQAILSPAWCAYLDMKYHPGEKLGLQWAGCVDVRQSYAWEPAALFPDLPESAILGVEAPLWTETLETIADLEYQLLPRLAGIAEIGWSPKEGRSWDEYRLRLGAHAPRLRRLGVNFYPAPEVAWR
jgi:hexosaminidase